MLQEERIVLAVACVLVTELTMVGVAVGREDSDAEAAGVLLIEGWPVIEIVGNCCKVIESIKRGFRKRGLCLVWHVY